MYKVQQNPRTQVPHSQQQYYPPRPAQNNYFSGMQPQADAYLQNLVYPPMNFSQQKQSVQQSIQNSNGLVMQADPELKQELENEQKIWTFSTQPYREQDEPDTLISFYITLTDQPIRLKVRQGENPEELANKFVSYCYNNSASQPPHTNDPHRLKLLALSLAYMIRMHVGAFFMNSAQIQPVESFSANKQQTQLPENLIQQKTPQIPDLPLNMHFSQQEMKDKAEGANSTQRTSPEFSQQDFQNASGSQG